jgi:hypothetical protein
MLPSDQRNWVALVSVDHQAHIGGKVIINILVIDFSERQTTLKEAQYVLRWLAHDTHPARTVQTVCNHPA